MRAFISIDIPEEVRKEIKKIQEVLPEFHGKKTELENLHLTLKFLGEVDENLIEKIKEKLKNIKLKSFEAEIDEIGVFSEKIVRIIWLHLTNCSELQKQIDNTVKDLFSVEHRFMSHLTIARVKGVKEKRGFLEELEKLKIPTIKFNVNNFRLKKSVLTAEGPVYETLEEYKLS